MCVLTKKREREREREGQWHYCGTGSSQEGDILGESILGYSVKLFMGYLTNIYIYIHIIYIYIIIIE